MKKRILNIGCGNETYGTDFVDLYPPKNRPEVKKVDIQKQKLPYPDNTFDEVYSKCLLEHCINPGEVLKEMVRVLKKGGKIRVITDNANYWTFALKNSLHRGSYEQEKSEDRHYILFTDWHLKNYMRKLGMKKVKVKYLPEKYIDQNKTKFFIKNLINKILRLTPLDKISYMRLELEAVK